MDSVDVKDIKDLDNNELIIANKELENFLSFLKNSIIDIEEEN